jgi:hypothetical protein
MTGNDKRHDLVKNFLNNYSLFLFSLNSYIFALEFNKTQKWHSNYLI